MTVLRSSLGVSFFALATFALASCSSSDPQEEAFDPLSIATMITFGGPEAPGFHDCFWIGPVSFESYNIAYPDEGAVYWGSKFQLPEDASHLEIDGAYPNARYMSYNAYDILTQPTDALIDHEIVPYVGANPYINEDKSGGRYKVKVFATSAPGGTRPENTLYLGDAGERNDELPLILRTYVPADGTDFTGGAGLPKVSLVMRDETRLSGEAACEALGNPRPGTPEREVPSVVVEQETYASLVDGPDSPKGFPASETPEWLKFWGGRVTMARLLPDRKYLEKAIADSAAGNLPKMSGFYANRHNDYISAYLSEEFGEVVVLKGKLPRTPAQGWDISSGDYEIRYWSICSNESLVTTRYSDCIYDSNVVLDENREFTIVVSKAHNRPVNATAECGVTWLDWGDRGDGAGDEKATYLIIRNMEGAGFAQSVQNVSSITAASEDMGPYFPVTSYSSKADFESGGCGID